MYVVLHPGQLARTTGREGGKEQLELPGDAVVELVVADAHDQAAEERRIDFLDQLSLAPANLLAAAIRLWRSSGLSGTALVTRTSTWFLLSIQVS